MKNSLTNANMNQTNRLKSDNDADLEERIPYVMTEEELHQYLEKKLPEWKKEVRRLSRDKKCFKKKMI